MGQRNLFLLDRLGTSQFWTGSWNSRNNYSSLFINFFFIDKIVSTFIKGKNSVNYFFIKKNDNLVEVSQKLNFIFDENFSMFNNGLQQKRVFKSFMYIFGTTLFFKYQTWYVICVSVYKPRGKKTKVRFSKNTSQLVNFFELKKDFFEKF